MYSTENTLIVLSLFGLFSFIVLVVWPRLPENIRIKVEAFNTVFRNIGYPILVAIIGLLALWIDDDIFRYVGIFVLSTLGVWFIYTVILNSRFVHKRIGWRWPRLFIVSCSMFMILSILVSAVFELAVWPIIGFWLLIATLIYILYQYAIQTGKRLNNDPAAAIEHATNQLKTTPDDMQILINRAIAYDRLQNYEAALADYAVVEDILTNYKSKKMKVNSAQIERTRATLHTNRARIFFQMGEPHEAIAECETGLAIRDLLPEEEALLMYNSASGHIELGDFETAHHLLNSADERFVILKPAEHKIVHAAVLGQRALIYYKQGDVDQALALWRKSLDIAPVNNDSEKLKENNVGPQWRLDAMLDMNERLKAMS